MMPSGLRNKMPFMSATSAGFRIARKMGLVGDHGLDPETGKQPQRNAPSPLRTFVPWLCKRGSRQRRRRSQSMLDVGRIDAAIRQVADEIHAHQCLRIEPDDGWTDTGVALTAGDSVSMLTAGRLFLSRALEISTSARGSLWYRVGDDDVHRMTGEGETVTAKQTGRLQLCIAIPGCFGTPQGDSDPDNPAPGLSGGFDVRIIQWQNPPAQAITRAAQQVPSIFAELQQTLDRHDNQPEAWQYFWRLGEAAIFSHCDDDGAVCCHTHGDVGIWQYPLSLPLDESMQLSWSWLMETLPSELPEHIQPTHDYLSIAVAFDNGLDLTWMWSAQLPAGTIFQCPLPWWDKRETHWVLHNARDGLNQWHDENRNILSDYRRAIGGPEPATVTGVWLIANSLFQNGHGSCRYRAINLSTNQQNITIQS